MLQTLLWLNLLNTELGRQEECHHHFKLPHIQASDKIFFRFSFHLSYMSIFLNILTLIWRSSYFFLPLISQSIYILLLWTSQALNKNLVSAFIQRPLSREFLSVLDSLFPLVLCFTHLFISLQCPKAKSFVINICSNFSLVFNSNTSYSSFLLTVLTMRINRTGQSENIIPFTKSHKVPRTNGKGEQSAQPFSQVTQLLRLIYLNLNPLLIFQTPDVIMTPTIWNR